jgi:hypothetical protein
MDSSELLTRTLDESLVSRLGTNVCKDSVCGARTTCVQFPLEIAEGNLRPICYHDRCTIGVKAMGQGTTDAIGGTSDYDGFSVHIHGFRLYDEQDGCDEGTAAGFV